MKELLDSLDAHFDKAEGWIQVVTADWIEDDVTLKLSIKLHDYRDPELWVVVCYGLVQESLCSDFAGTFTVSDESPLSKRFAEQEVPIMFSDNALAPEALFGIVCSCCMEVMEKPESITMFINGAPSVDGIANSRYGLLGRFPESLAARILDALKDKPIKVNALPGFRPVRWNGSVHVDYSPLQVLEIGSSYVVAQRFSAHRLADPQPAA